MSQPVLTIPLPAGYRPDWVLSFLRRDPAGLAERVEGDTVSRMLSIGGQPIRADLTLGPDAATVRLDPDPGEAGSRIAMERLRRMLGLTVDGEGLEAAAASDPVVARLLKAGQGLRPHVYPTVWEGATWAIVGQQVNLTFATTLRRTVIELAGSPHPSGMMAHPGPEAVARLSVDDLTARKFSRNKAGFLLGAARAAAEGTIDFEALPGLPPEEAEARMAVLKGFGPWTRQYILLRACGFPDCVPAGDAGLAAALQNFHGLPRRPTPTEQIELMRPFAPWRSLATVHMWASWS